MTLFDVQPAQLTPPRDGVLAGVSRPVWTEYRPKTPVDCNHCERVALETVLEGKPYPGIRIARRRRKQDGNVLVLCHEHAQIQAAADNTDLFSDVEG